MYIAVIGMSFSFPNSRNDDTDKSYDVISAASDPSDMMKGVGAANHLTQPKQAWMCNVSHFFS